MKLASVEAVARALEGLGYRPRVPVTAEYFAARRRSRGLPVRGRPADDSPPAR